LQEGIQAAVFTLQSGADEKLAKTIKITNFDLTSIQHVNNHCFELTGCVIYFTKKFFEVQKKLIEDIKGFQNNKQTTKTAKLLHTYIQRNLKHYINRFISGFKVTKLEALVLTKAKAIAKMKNLNTPTGIISAIPVLAIILM
jgi:hypothetical protein